MSRLSIRTSFHTILRVTWYSPLWFVAALTVHTETLCANTRSAPVSIDLEYNNGEASEVYLVWGLNRDWSTLPFADAPVGTRIQQDLMYTPMAPDQARFRVRLSVPAGSVVNYMFYITRNSSGQAVEAWDKGPVSGDGYRVVAEQYAAVRNRQAPNLELLPLAGSEAGKLIRQEISYAVSGVRDVSLVWGVNDWQIPAANSWPSRSSTEDQMMMTPMYFDGEVFSLALNLPQDTELNFVFLITKLEDGRSVRIWQSSKTSSHRFVAKQNNSIHIDAALPTVDKLFAATFNANIEFLPMCFMVFILPALAVVAVAFASILLAQRGWGMFAWIEQLLLQEATHYRLSLNLLRSLFWTPLLILVGFFGYLYLGLHGSAYLPQFLDPGGDYVFKTQVIKENGFVEISTVAFLFLASMFSLAVARGYWWGPLCHELSARWKAGLFLLLGVGAFFIAMEEISWGQWLLYFETPEAWKEVNAQSEINLHNLEIFQHGVKELPLVVFGLAGLVSRLFVHHPVLKVLATPRVELGWFTLIVILSIVLYVAYWPWLVSEYLSLPGILLWGARQYAEVIEMMVGMSAFVFASLKYRELCRCPPMLATQGLLRT
jgi:hypothetical protein